jgi:hypothetical protein
MDRIGELARKRVERIVVENELLRAGFAAFPYLIMRDMNLSVGARLTYAFLLMYAWQEGSCFTKQASLAETMGVSTRHLQRYLYELREADYIRITREDRRFNNTYILLDKKPTKLKKRSKHYPG